jgi:hypothetical protein
MVASTLLSQVDQQPRLELEACDIPTFCVLHQISQGGFYGLLRKGQAPRTFKAGGRTLISREAAADWRRQMESATQHPGKEAEVTHV